MVASGAMVTFLEAFWRVISVSVPSEMVEMLPT